MPARAQSSRFRPAAESGRHDLGFFDLFHARRAMQTPALREFLRRTMERMRALPDAPSFFTKSHVLGLARQVCIAPQLDCASGLSHRLKARKKVPKNGARMGIMPLCEAFLQKRKFRGFWRFFCTAQEILFGGMIFSFRFIASENHSLPTRQVLFQEKRRHKYTALQHLQI